MYRYTVEKFDMASLEGFATGFYKNMKASGQPKQILAVIPKEVESLI